MSAPEESAALSAAAVETPVAPLLSGGHVPVLDGVRGLAILLVMIHHLFRSLEPNAGVWEWMGVIARSSWIGVDLFFVLSGFLITGILLDTRSKPHHFRNFYMRRTLRIFPLYFGTLVVVLGLGALAHRVSTKFQWHEFLAAQPWLFTFTNNIHVALAGGWTAQWSAINLSHFWSLAVEEQFYLVWPVLIFFVPRRWSAYLAAAVIAAALAIRLALIQGGASPFVLYVLTPCRFDALACGALIAVLIRSVNLRAGVAWLRVGAIGAFAALAVMAVYQGGLDWQNRWTEGLGFSLLSGGFACVLAVAVVSRGWTQRVLDVAVLRFLGKYSYGIYMFHVILQGPINAAVGPEKLGPRLGVPLAWLVFLTAMTVASLALAIMSYRFFEAPILRLRRYF